MSLYHLDDNVLLNKRKFDPNAHAIEEYMKINTRLIELPTIRQRVNAIEAEMKKQPQLELRHENYFSLGVYARALYIPAGTILVGKIHKYPQLNFLMQGVMQVLVGEEIQQVTAPFIVNSPAGTKRIAQALEDCLWVTVHGTNLTDVDEIEQHFIAQDEDEFQQFVEELAIREMQLALPL